MSQQYKKAGVDIATGEALVDWLKSNTPRQVPHQDRLIGGVGGFAALFRADFPEMSQPCLVSSTDGVGTKLKLAVEFETYGSLGQDLVAMCVNDLICVGAQPLFFLDYYAVSQLELSAAKQFLGGVQSACLESHCALIGGETAEMPGVYHGKDFDCAGFCVGVVDRPNCLGAHRVQDGDCVVAISSNGFHSNGFSLLRQVFSEDLADWKDHLLKPTHLYVRLFLALSEICSLHAIAHITGGGINNILRVLPNQTRVELNPWEVPPEFLEVKKRAKMSWTELLTTLNSGVGLALVLPAKEADQAIKTAQQQGFNAFKWGSVRLNQAEPSCWVLDDHKMSEKNLLEDDSSSQKEG